MGTAIILMVAGILILIYTPDVIRLVLALKINRTTKEAEKEVKDES